MNLSKDKVTEIFNFADNFWIAYSFFPKKPAIKFEVVTTNQLSLF